MSEDTNNLTTSFLSMSLYIMTGGREEASLPKDTRGAAVMWLWLLKAGKIYHPQSQKNCYWSRQEYDLSLCACVLNCFSRLTLCNSMDCSPPASPVHGDSPGKNTGVGCHVLLQGIFPTQGLNPGLLHCRQIFYSLSHQGSPRILEWVSYPFSGVSSQLKNQSRVSCIAGRFFTSWATILQ